VNEQVDNAEYEFLWKLLANPAEPNHSYVFNLQSLVTDFPQSGVLRALLMPNGDKRHIKHAAAYFNPRVLHKLATAPDSLPKVSPDQVVFSDKPSPLIADAYLNVPVEEAFVPPVIDEPVTAFTPLLMDDNVEEAPMTDTYEVSLSEPENYTFSEPEPAVTGSETAPYLDKEGEDEPGDLEGDDVKEHETQEISSYSSNTYHEPQAYDAAEDFRSGTPIDEEPVHEEISEAPIIEYPNPTQAEAVIEQTGAPAIEESLADQYEAYLAESESEPTTPVSSYEDTEDRYFHQAIDDEVYDEIVSIEDIGLEQLAVLNRSAGEDSKPEENYFVFDPQSADVDAPATEMALSEYEASVQNDTAAEPAAEEPQVDVASSDLHPAVIMPLPVAQQVHTAADATRDMSRYHDEKMPYSFMWWLDKTRKEHANVYQPYVKQSTPQAAAQTTQTVEQKEPLDELQKQYYQNIVSTTSITELDENLSKIPPMAAPRKEDKIIQRFIQEEPHIKHPAGAKLDNENKAKRSSEDKEELVTETLARIYTEQMLYHKAILTYKKLMLKYPEKSLYFAGQIEQLENKIN
jgi:hypothetical protein